MRPHTPLARSAKVELSDAYSIMAVVKALPTRRLLELAGFGWEQAAGFALIRRRTLRLGSNLSCHAVDQRK